MVVEAKVRKTSKGKFSSEQYFVFFCSSEWPNKFATRAARLDDLISDCWPSVVINGC